MRCAMGKGPAHKRTETCAHAYTDVYVRMLLARGFYVHTRNPPPCGGRAYGKNTRGHTGINNAPADDDEQASRVERPTKHTHKLKRGFVMFQFRYSLLAHAKRAMRLYKWSDTTTTATLGFLSLSLSLVSCGYIGCRLAGIPIKSNMLRVCVFMYAENTL